MAVVRKESENRKGDIYQIRDINKIFLNTCGAIVVLGVMWDKLFTLGIDETIQHIKANPGWMAMLGFVWITCLFVAIANFRGIIINMAQDTMEFPGGGVSANNFLEYLNPLFWMQQYRRYKIKVSSIRQISTIRTRKWFDKEHTNFNYCLCLNGSFGAVKIKFNNEDKRDELYSMIRELNEMGTPVIKG